MTQQVTYQLAKAAPADIDELHGILRACGLDMKTRFGLTHWERPYPLHLMRQSAAERDVYAVRVDGRAEGATGQPPLHASRTTAIATFTLGVQAPDYHASGASYEPGVPATYLNRLAVLPEWQGNGVGTWCVRMAERLAAEAGSKVLRLDAYEQHALLLQFYKRLGFRRVGYTHIGERRLVCYEKPLPALRQAQGGPCGDPLHPTAGSGGTLIDGEAGKAPGLMTDVTMM